MTAKLMDGKAVAARTLESAAQRVDSIQQQTGVTPCLATVLVGADPASVTYTQMKRKRCEGIGMLSRKVELPAETTTAELVKAVADLGADPTVHGILLQHPTPSHIDERAAFEAIPVAKDVDGVTYGSFSRMWFGELGFASCTPGGIVRLLDAYDVPLQSQHAVVIGRSAILGKPMAGLLLARHATVTICHSRTKHLGEIVKQADLVVAAVGKPEFVRGDWIKEGAVVMDAGYNAGNVGDVAFEEAKQHASLITPVPGGVGPMTIATLIDQTVDAAASQLGVTTNL
jgi:methylenetetrahydrofolate dehydrogenase (NADP+)/methenyltetrahydrofolate cyclohydrolase